MVTGLSHDDFDASPFAWLSQGAAETQYNHGLTKSIKFDTAEAIKVARIARGYVPALKITFVEAYSQEPISAMRIRIEPLKKQGFGV
jgi:hypothetical protein